MSPQSISLSVILLTSTVSIITQVESLNFSFPRFGNESKRSLILSNNSDVAFNAIWMGPHEYDRQLSNQEYSGRAIFNQQLNLWDQKRGMEASFRSSFEVSIINMSSSGGDGYAFILSRNSSVPENSTGQWLGIVNSATVGESNNVVAVEFDTRKSFQEDIDNNHVGLDINSIYSVIQESVGPGTYLWNGSVFTSLEYDASIGRIRISMRQGGDTNTLFYDVRLSEHLPEFVFVGFSAATRHVSQMVSVRSWSFTSSEVITARNDSDLVFVWIIVPVVTSLIGISWVLYRKKKQQRNQVENDPQIEQEIQSSSTAPHKFRLKELKSATQNFNPMNQLGKGGFGTVYKGILCDKEVAVKRISKNSRHGKQDFIAEITTIGNLNHKNLVKLMGWCYGSDELLLVYEFMPNGSLDKLLFGGELEESVLTWETRHGIISDVAQGLDYLHYGCEKRVLHPVAELGLLIRRVEIFTFDYLKK